MNRGYDWRLGKVRSIATDGKVIYDTALSKFRLSDAFEHTYDPFLNTIGALLNYNPVDDATVNLLASGRSGLTIVDSISAANLTILTPVYKGNNSTLTGDKTRAAEKLFDGNSYTIYFKIKQLIDINTGVTNARFVLNFGRLGSAIKRGISFYTSGLAWYSDFSDGTTRKETTTFSNCNTTLKPAGWVDVFIQINTTTNRAIVNLFKISDGSALGTSSNLDISAFVFNSNDNELYLQWFNGFLDPTFAFADFKKFSGLKTIAQCRDNSYVTDLQMFYPTLLDGTDVSGNDNHLAIGVARYNDTRHYDSKSTYILDKGYSVYGKYNSADIVIPNDINGGAITRADLTGYALIKTVSGNLTAHNLTDSLIEFTGTVSALFDRSDTTIFSDAARGIYTYYDSVNPKRWHISELNVIVLNDFYNSDYKNKVFIKISNNSTDDRNLLNEIFSVTTQKTGSDLISVLKYTGDYETPKNLTNGQFVLTFDDMVESQYTKLFPICKTKNIKVTIGLITTVATYKEQQEIYRWGIHLADHSHLSRAFPDLTDAEIDTEMGTVNSEFNKRGFAIPEHCIYPGGQYDAESKIRIALWRKTGSTVGGTIPFNAANPALDKFQLARTKIDEVTNLTAIKAAITSARNNNQAVILYGHELDTGSQYSTTSELLIEIIDYAIASGIEFMTLKELYDNVMTH